MAETKVKEGPGWDKERIKANWKAILKRFETDSVQIRRSLNTLGCTMHYRAKPFLKSRTSELCSVWKGAQRQQAVEKAVFLVWKWPRYEKLSSCSELFSQNGRTHPTQVFTPKRHTWKKSIFKKVVFDPKKRGNFKRSNECAWCPNILVGMSRSLFRPFCTNKVLPGMVRPRAATTETFENG